MNRQMDPSFPVGIGDADPRMIFSSVKTDQLINSHYGNLGLAISPYQGHSLSREHIRFQKELVRRLQDAIPFKSFNDGTVSESCLSKDWFNCLSVAGYVQSQFHAPPTDTTKFMKDKGLSVDGWKDERHESIANFIFDVIHSTFKEANVVLRAGSSSMIPFHRKERAYRMLNVFRARDRWRNWVKYVKRGRYSDLWLDEKVAFASVILSRVQADKVIKDANGKLVGKPREVASLTYALSNGEKGSIDIASKDVYINNELIEGVFGSRWRNVFAVPGLITALGMPIANGFFSAFTDRFPGVTKFRSHQDIEDSLNRFEHAAGLDVGNNDFYFHKWQFAFYFNRLKKYVDPDFCDLMFASALNTLLITPRFPTKGEPVLANNPFKYVGSSACGLQSGHPFNSLFSWTMNLIARFLTMDDYFKFEDPFEAFMEVMENRHDLVGLLFGNDNAVFTDKTGKFIGDCRERVKKKGSFSDYQTVDFSPIIHFLGSIAVKFMGKKKVYQDMNSFIKTKVSEVERHWKHPTRRLTHQEGLLNTVDELDDYHKTLSYDEVLNIYTSTIRDFFHIDVIDVHRAFREENFKNEPDKVLLPKTKSETLLQADPAKALYMPSILDDCRPEFVEKFYVTIPGSVLRKHYQDLVTNVRRIFV